jgi:hypothetical protein
MFALFKGTIFFATRIFPESKTTISESVLPKIRGDVLEMMMSFILELGYFWPFVEAI